jgi:hypothetical protein
MALGTANARAILELCSDHNPARESNGEACAKWTEKQVVCGVFRDGILVVAAASAVPILLWAALAGHRLYGLGSS